MIGLSLSDFLSGFPSKKNANVTNTTAIAIQKQYTLYIGYMSIKSFKPYIDVEIN